MKPIDLRKLESSFSPISMVFLAQELLNFILSRAPNYPLDIYQVNFSEMGEKEVAGISYKVFKVKYLGAETTDSLAKSLRMLAVFIYHLLKQESELTDPKYLLSGYDFDKLDINLPEPADQLFKLAMQGLLSGQLGENKERLDACFQIWVKAEKEKIRLNKQKLEEEEKRIIESEKNRREEEEHKKVVKNQTTGQPTPESEQVGLKASQPIHQIDWSKVTEGTLLRVRPDVENGTNFAEYDSESQKWFKSQAGKYVTFQKIDSSLMTRNGVMLRDYSGIVFNKDFFDLALYPGAKVLIDPNARNLKAEENILNLSPGIVSTMEKLKGTVVTLMQMSETGAWFIKEGNENGVLYSWLPEWFLPVPQESTFVQTAPTEQVQIDWSKVTEGTLLRVRPDVENGTNFAEHVFASQKFIKEKAGKYVFFNNSRIDKDGVVLKSSVVVYHKDFFDLALYPGAKVLIDPQATNLKANETVRSLGAFLVPQMEKFKGKIVTLKSENQFAWLIKEEEKGSQQFFWLPEWFLPVPPGQIPEEQAPAVVLEQVDPEKILGDDEIIEIAGQRYRRRQLKVGEKVRFVNPDETVRPDFLKYVGGLVEITALGDARFSLSIKFAGGEIAIAPLKHLFPDLKPGEPVLAHKKSIWDSLPEKFANRPNYYSREFRGAYLLKVNKIDGNPYCIIKTNINSQLEHCFILIDIGDKEDNGQRGDFYAPGDFIPLEEVKDS